MPEYTLREVDPHVWSLFTERAGREGWPTKALLVKLMDAYGRGDVSVGTPPPKQFPLWAGARTYYRAVARAHRAPRRLAGSNGVEGTTRRSPARRPRAHPAMAGADERADAAKRV